MLRGFFILIKSKMISQEKKQKHTSLLIWKVCFRTINTIKTDFFILQFHILQGLLRF